MLTDEELKKHTPMMQAYLKIKQDFPDKLVFYRMGDFYELFFDDAVEASKILGITLTKRGTSDSSPIPMAGVPFHSVESYIHKAVNKNKSIVICEQVGEATPGKGLMERKVARIITPGTVIDGGVLQDKDIKILASIFLRGKNVEIAWMNFASGEVWCNKVSINDIYSELMRINPVEVLLSDKQFSQIVIPENIATSIVSDWEYDFTLADNSLKTYFGEQYLHRFGLPSNVPIAGVISSLLSYLKTTQCIEIHHIHNIKWYKGSEFLLLDSNTKRHLEILQSSISSIGGVNESTLWNTLDQCSTSMGSRLLKDWLNYPIRDKSVLNSRFDRVSALIEKKSYNSWQGFSSQWCDIERISTRISLRTVKPRELAALRDTFRGMPKLVSWGETLPAHLRGFLAHAYPNEGIVKILEKYLLEEPAAWIRDGSVIANGIDAELDSCRLMQKGHDEFLKEFENQEKINTNIPNLKVEYNSAQGFYISISKSHSDKAPEHYKRKQTLKNAERYTTKDLLDYEQKALSAKDRALSREKYLFEELLNKLQNYVSILQKQSKVLAEWDILNSFAKISEERNYVRPLFNDYMQLKMVAGRHPVIEMNRKNFVPNNLILNAHENLAIITGPNMGGKSTVMRQVALSIIMAHIGCFVPASEFHIPEVDAIFTRIGANDDISNGRSTFMVEMSETSFIMNNATENSLVLLDELGRGTATYDGLSLAWSIAEYLGTKIKSLSLFATHYLEMTDLEKKHSNIKNLHVSAIDHGDGLVFTYILEPGPASRSYGIHVAELAGLKSEILHNAEEKLAELESNPNNKNSETYLLENLHKKIKNLNLNDMTPLQAFIWLSEQQKKINEN